MQCKPNEGVNRRLPRHRAGIRGNKKSTAFFFDRKRTPTGYFICDGSADNVGQGLRGYLVDLVGIEPTTSSMPCCERNRKLLTVQWL